MTTINQAGSEDKRQPLLKERSAREAGKRSTKPTKSDEETSIKQFVSYFHWIYLFCLTLARSELVFPGGVIAAPAHCAEVQQALLASSRCRETARHRLGNQFQNLREARIDVSGPRLETFFLSRQLETIPGADVLADITAIEPAVQISRDRLAASPAHAIRWSHRKCICLNRQHKVR